MRPETKQQTLTKLAAIRHKIGYADKWRELQLDEDRRRRFCRQQRAHP
jgi:predicted metalloendopeptidase